MPPATEVRVWEQAYSTELEGELERRMEMLLLQIAIRLDFSMNHNHSPSQLKKKKLPRLSFPCVENYFSPFLIPLS